MCLYPQIVCTSIIQGVTRCVFYISKLLKTSRPKSHQVPIDFKAYPRDVSLCAVALIKLYLDETVACKLHVFYYCSYVAPHKPVLSRSLARWVLDVLQEAGIHTKTFKTYSLRSASTSNVFSSDLSFTKIVKTSCTNVKTL